MARVFDLYVADEDRQRSASPTLPATNYEMVDILERLGSENIDSLYFEIDKSYRGEFLTDALESGITIRELNILAWKISEMDEEQEAAFEGLVKMEQKTQHISRLPYPKLLQLAENTDCCHVVSEARNDSQLGRFYAENGFVEGADDLPDNLFELLDFEKIGREIRLEEGGVFTEDSGYVVRHSELRELKKLPDLGFRKPYYTMLLELRLAEYENGPVLQLELPMTKEHIQSLAEKYLLEDETVRCTDCAIPFFLDYIGKQAVSLQELNDFAQMMDFALERGELAKYKAILLATSCRDVSQAAELGKYRWMEEYRFLPYQGEGDPEKYAANWLKKTLGKEARLVPDEGLEELGRRLMERDHVIETGYGPVRRVDCQPIQRMEQEHSTMEMTM